jgi:nitroreductase
MQLDRVIIGRRSIRRYKKKEVPISLIGEILDLARFTPSSGNLQNWRFVIVTDIDKRNEISDACLQQDWMSEAPVHIVVCNDYEDVKKHYGKLGKMYSIQNISNISYAISLIAYDKGLGSCWVGAFDNQAIQRILQIPENMDPEVIITLGYTNEIKQPSMRDDLNYMAYFNSWGNSISPVPSHLDKLRGMVNVSNLKKHMKKLKD